MAARETFRGCSSPGRRPKARESSPGSPASSVSQPRAAWSPPADATLRRKARKFAFPTRRTTTSTSAGSRAGITRVARRGILPAEIRSVPETRSSQDRLTYRACHLCEALCGIEIRSRGDEIVAVRGDAADPFSRGHVCPKAVALIDIHNDPDRLRGPVRRVDGRWEPIGWDEAFDLVAGRFAAIQREHGANALGVYLGNPNAHHVGSILNGPALLHALQTRNRFSATSVDQLPQHVVSHAMYGHLFMFPIPDVDHTAYWLILGANPIASNGSIMSVPDVGKRLTAIRDRGGKVVVVDPCRTETADVATRHPFIRPGTDTAFLLALVNAFLELGPPRIARYGEPPPRLERALPAIRAFGVERALAPTGISAQAARAIARELRHAPSPVVYGRVGLCTQPFGTVCQWLIHVA